MITNWNELERILVIYIFFWFQIATMDDEKEQYFKDLEEVRRNLTAELREEKQSNLQVFNESIFALL